MIHSNKTQTTRNQTLILKLIEIMNAPVICIPPFSINVVLDKEMEQIVI